MLRIKDLKTVISQSLSSPHTSCEHGEHKRERSLKYLHCTLLFHQDFPRSCHGVTIFSSIKGGNGEDDLNGHEFFEDIRIKYDNMRNEILDIRMYEYTQEDVAEDNLIGNEVSNENEKTNL